MTGFPYAFGRVRQESGCRLKSPPIKWLERVENFMRPRTRDRRNPAPLNPGRAVRVTLRSIRESFYRWLQREASESLDQQGISNE